MESMISSVPESQHVIWHGSIIGNAKINMWSMWGGTFALYFSKILEKKPLAIMEKGNVITTKGNEDVLGQVDVLILYFFIFPSD